MTDVICYASHIRIPTNIKFLFWEKLETLQAILLALTVIKYTFYCKRKGNKFDTKVNSI